MMTIFLFFLSSSFRVSYAREMLLKTWREIEIVCRELKERERQKRRIKQTNISFPPALREKKINHIHFSHMGVRFPPPLLLSPPFYCNTVFYA